VNFAIDKYYRKLSQFRPKFKTAESELRNL